MKNDNFEFVDKSYRKFKNENKGYRIIDEIEKIKLRKKTYYAAINDYTHIYGIDFGASLVVDAKTDEPTDLYCGYIQYNNNCIIKELRKTEYKDQSFDFSDRETCYSHIITKVLYDLKSAVEYCDEEERKKYLELINR
ncbi:MAG: hypothetical protein H6Q16_2118 [Bacteroidetes bacterium]|nr:hypothetical protein [Bacteroidota bacterium]